MVITKTKGLPFCEKIINGHLSMSSPIWAFFPWSPAPMIFFSIFGLKSQGIRISRYILNQAINQLYCAYEKFSPYEVYFLQTEHLLSIKCVVMSHCTYY